MLGEELIPPGREPAPDEEARLKASLLGAVGQLEGRLGKTPWLCGTAKPSAADFALYGCLERLVGTEGDARMGAAAPWLWAEAGAPKLQAWYRRMVEEFPIRFVGKGKECKVWGLKG